MPLDLDTLIEKTRKAKRKVQAALFDLDSLITKTSPVPVPAPRPVRPAPAPVAAASTPSSVMMRKVLRPLPAWGICDILVHRETGGYGVVDAIVYGPPSDRPGLDHWMILVKILAKDGRVIDETRLFGADTSIDAWRALAPDQEFGDPVLAKWVERWRKRYRPAGR
jgi:hypothetical protein